MFVIHLVEWNSCLQKQKQKQKQKKIKKIKKKNTKTNPKSFSEEIRSAGFIECYSKNLGEVENQDAVQSGSVSKEMRCSLSGKRETSSERFATSKSWNWKAGAQVHPARAKWYSPFLEGSLTTAPSGETVMSFVGKDPNQTFGGTVYCGWYAHLCHSALLSRGKKTE
jgi:hypothetical protein